MDFYLGWLKNPKRIGAIAPTSAAMARKMASVIRPDSGLPVLELGPGTGAITKAILARKIDPGNLISVEFSEIFIPGLKRRFPGANFVHGDAFDVAQIAEDNGIGKFDSAISGLPLLNFPIDQRTRLVEMILDHLEPGRPLVQFSYGLKPPVRALANHFTVNHLGTIWGNLPPARIWTYQREVADVDKPCVVPQKISLNQVDAN